MLMAGVAIVAALGSLGVVVKAHSPLSTTPAPRIELSSDGASVPMKLFGRRPVVDLTINGKGPYEFILDTGADVTMIDSALAKELALPAADANVEDLEPSERAVRIDNAALGDARMLGLVAGTAPLGSFFRQENPPRGVLSAASFPGYLLTLDYLQKRVTIEKGALPAPDEKSVFAYPAEDLLPTLPVHVAGVSTRIHLDSGSPMGLVLPTKFIKQVPTEGEPKVIGKAHTPSGEALISQAKVKGEITLGKYILVLDSISFSDVSPGNVPPTGNLGYDVLQHFAVTLDSQNRRIRLAQ